LPQTETAVQKHIAWLQATGSHYSFFPVGTLMFHIFSAYFKLLNQKS